MLVGLTGAYCAGKNRVAGLLEARGFETLDVDKLGHRALELAKDQVVARFGSDCLTAEGAVDRKALGRLVFGRPEALAELEAIVHPVANRLSEEWVAARPGRRLVINAALLPKSSLFGRLDFIIMVRAPWTTRLLRARRRDGLGWKELFKRFGSQKSFEAQYFSAVADIHTVENRGVGPCGARRNERALERRLDTIFAREGMVR